VIPIAGLKTLAGPLLKPTMHIFTGDKGDSVVPSDDLPQFEGWPN
jgi:hypothetical protein